MKIKDGYLLRQVAGQNVVLSMHQDLNLNRMITLNGTGAFLWQQLQQETDEAALTRALLAEYDVTEDRAAASVRTFLAKLEANGLLA